MSNRVIVLLLVAAMGGGGIARAGDLEPPGPPAPTMKTLDEIPGSWHRILGPERFELVMGGDGVLDLETGLVWQRAPDLLAQGLWNVAVKDCLNATTGGRKGWRLPTVEELATLVDPSQSSPALPPGHPFLYLAPNDRFWTITTPPYVNPDYTVDLHKVFVVDFFVGFVSMHEKLVDPLQDWIKVWCVRGGSGHDFAGQY